MLTDVQQSIITQTAQNTVVFACPGSGKTTVLTYHIANQVVKYRMAPESIMAMTFTRQAASDMHHRLQEIGTLSEKAARSVVLGTFHAQLFKLMLSIFPDIPRLLSPIEQMQLMKQVIEESRWTTHRISEREIQQYLTQICNYQSQWPRQPVPIRLKKVFRNYEKRKKLAHRWDFDDILVGFLEIIQKRPRWPLLERLRFLLVDEFQDTNKVQWEILMAIRNQYKVPIFVVGDDDQSIYSFRGASPQWLLNYHLHVEDTKRLILATNFRSDVRIVNSAKVLIENNQRRQSKPFEISRKDLGGVSRVACANEFDEAKQVIQLILAERRQRPEWTIAVLSRTRRQMYETWRAARLQSLSGVQFRTFHDAKGKEWDSVFIVGAVHANPYLADDKSLRNVIDIEEERRLFYVAVTRARHHCVILHPEKIHQIRCKESVFLSEMKEHLTSLDDI